MPQCIPSGLVIATQKINKEDVLPGAAAHRARFDLAEADVAQSKDAKRLEERAGRVLQCVSDRGLICLRLKAPFAAYQEKPREVLLVVFDFAQQHFSTILLGGVDSGDPSRVLHVLLNDVFHAAGGVVK